MHSSQPSSPHRRLWHTAKEYLTHWFVAGVIVTMTGFTPDHWIAHVFHAVNLDQLRGVFADYKFLAVYIGVTFLIVDGVVRYRTRQLRPDPSAHAAAAGQAPPAAAAIDDKLSIAVLPFVNMSDDKSREYLADGMTEDIITGLSCDSRLFVIARNSTFAYKGQAVDIRAIGKELGVRYVLEGSIRPLGERLRITMQLVETATGSHVWSDKIDRPEAELFDVMDEVVDGLVTTLFSNLGIAEARRAARQHPEHLQAWALCVQAEAHSLQIGPEATAAEGALLQQATRIEPGYALGWALLAKWTSTQIGKQTGAARAADKALTLSHAEKALKLAPHDPVVLGYCGFVFVLTGITMRGIDCLERSLDLNPNSGKFRLYYGFALWADGRPEEGLAQLNMFMRLSPRDPHLGLAYSYYSNCYLALEEYEQAEQSARNSIKLLPGFLPGAVNLVLALAAQGRVDEARQEMKLLQPQNTGWTRELLEDLWRGQLKQPEQVEKLIALAQMAWPD